MSASPQPLTGTEIKHGIAVRMTQGLPTDIASTLRERIIEGLGKTCSLLPSSAYAKFKANWSLTWWIEGEHADISWWVDYELDDFGRITKGGIGGPILGRRGHGREISGEIEEMPPDRFRRETDQPIPKQVEAKPEKRDVSTFSKSARRPGKRRDV